MRNLLEVSLKPKKATRILRSASGVRKEFKKKVSVFPDMVPFVDCPNYIKNLWFNTCKQISLPTPPWEKENDKKHEKDG
jgi:hypothetical protein